ncbi:MAG: Fur family transcriptional regulator [Myxococcota bacterium]
MVLNREEIEAEVVAELRDAGLKVTPQRLAVFRALWGDETHPTAQEIYERLQEEFPSMSFATVYNTLDALAGIGRVRPLALGGATRFDPNVEPHHHAVCDRCGAVRDVPASPHQARRTPAEVSGFRVRRVERLYRGLCPDCAGAEGS